MSEPTRTQAAAAGGACPACGGDGFRTGPPTYQPCPACGGSGAAPADLAELLRLAEGVLLPLTAHGVLVMTPDGMRGADTSWDVGQGVSYEDAVRIAAYLAAAANAAPGLCRRLGEAEAEVDRLRAGEEAVRQVLIQMYAAAVAGMADAVLVADQEYGPGHVLAVVRQLADDAKRVRARVADLEAALRPFAAYAAELDRARVPDLAPCAYFPGIGVGGHAPTARDHRRAAAALAAKEAGRG